MDVDGGGYDKKAAWKRKMLAEGRCFVCQKTGHMANRCPDWTQHIRAAEEDEGPGEISKEDLEELVESIRPKN